MKLLAFLVVHFAEHLVGLERQEADCGKVSTSTSAIWILMEILQIPLKGLTLAGNVSSGESSRKQEKMRKLVIW